jgi:hypothetical protein
MSHGGSHGDPIATEFRTATQPPLEAPAPSALGSIGGSLQEVAGEQECKCKPDAAAQL